MSARKVVGELRERLLESLDIASMVMGPGIFRSHYAVESDAVFREGLDP